MNMKDYKISINRKKKKSKKSEKTKKNNKKKNIDLNFRYKSTEQIEQEKKLERMNVQKTINELFDTILKPYDDKKFDIIGIRTIFINRKRYFLVQDILDYLKFSRRGDRKGTHQSIKRVDVNKRPMLFKIFEKHELGNLTWEQGSVHFLTKSGIRHFLTKNCRKKKRFELINHIL